MTTRNWKARLGILALIVTAGSLAAVATPGSATAATVCTADVCVITSGFAGLQADIAGSGASAPIVDLLTREVALSQALHPPNPCYAGHPPGPCTPAFGFLASAYLLVLVDYQVGALSGLIPRAACPGGCTRASCPGGCSFPPPAARLIDGEIRTMFADQTLFPAGLVALPQFLPGPSA